MNEFQIKRDQVKSPPHLEHHESHAKNTNIPHLTPGLFSSPENILQLQRAIGNQAVIQLLGAIQLHDLNSKTHSYGVIQYCKEKDEKKKKKKDFDEALFVNKDGSYYTTNGVTFSTKTIDTLENFINQYDVAVNQDFRKKQSLDKKFSDSLSKIAIGLTNIIDFIESNRYLNKFLDSVIHPKTGLSFIQYVDKCKLGNDCNNELAGLLRGCLSTLEFVKPEKDQEEKDEKKKQDEKD